MKRTLHLLLSLILVCTLCACSGIPTSQNSGAYTDSADTGGEMTTLEEDGIYDSKNEVALYIHLYDKLPSNYITKKEAQKLGWEGGSLEEYAPGKCIGGDHFGNYEEKLPQDGSRSYHECDIDTLGAKSRGPKRIIYSDDGLIFYTGDHYKTFVQLYGENDD